MTRPLDIAVIGGGLVGLATTDAVRRVRPQLSLTVLEKEPEVAAHQVLRRPPRRRRGAGLRRVPETGASPLANHHPGAMALVRPAGRRAKGSTPVAGVARQDLRTWRSGIRAQAVAADGALIHDFVIGEAPGVVHVLNAPSPAATACLVIGEHIAQRALRQFDPA